MQRLREINQFRMPNQILRIEEVISRDRLPHQSLSRRRIRIEHDLLPSQLNGVPMTKTADTICSAAPN